jgi:5-methylphenazine-1-carboxylate 1-monooxygenase
MGSNGATQAIIDAATLASRLVGCGAADDVPGALRAYESDRRALTNRLVLLNRTGGPERVIDLVEKLAPGGFEDINEVMPIDELRRVVADYAAMGSPVRT